MSVERWQNDEWQEKTKVLTEKPVPVPLCPPQIPCRLPWDVT